MGKWVANKTQSWIADESGELVLSIHTSYRTREEVEKIKALASAAPELLEALDRAYLEIVSLLNEGHFDRKVVLDLGYIVDAIAKATGADTEMHDDGTLAVGAE